MAKLRHATITLKDEDGLWHVQTDDGFNVTFESSQDALNWVRARDEESGVYFTVIEWRGTKEGFVPPVWKVLD